MDTPLAHSDLLNLGNQLGYRIDSLGLCQGFSMMLCQAWLAKSEKRLIKRLMLLEKYKNNLYLQQDIDNAREHAKKIPFDALDEKTKILLEIPAFYEGIKLYQSPHEHADIFANNQALAQTQIEIIYPVARPKQLEQASLAVVLSKTYAFNRRNLIDYLNVLKIALNQTPAIAPIVLSSDKHTVCLRYKKGIKAWQYVDTNGVTHYPHIQSYIRELDNQALIDNIFLSLDCANKIHAIFNTTIITTSDRYSALRSALDAGMQEFCSNHPITKTWVDTYPCDSSELLFLAFENRNINLLKILLRYEDNAINHTPFGYTLLYQACCYGWTEGVLALLQHKRLSVNQPIENQHTPLWIACKNKHYEIAFILLQHIGIAVNQADIFGNTPLLAAHQNKDFRIIQAIQQHESMIGNQLAASKKLGNRLGSACQQRDLEAVMALLQHKDIAINQPDLCGVTPFWIACQNGHLRVIEALLKHPGIAINHAQYHGITPLWVACQNRHIKVVKELLKHPGIDVNQADCHGNTPLHVACRYGDIVMARILLQHENIIATQANKLGLTPLNLVYQHKQSSRLISLLHAHLRVEKWLDRERLIYPSAGVHRHVFFPAEEEEKNSNESPYLRPRL